MSSSQRERTSCAPAPQRNTAVTLHYRERNSLKQPLYRPAALRRPGTSSVDHYSLPSPPGSPSLASTEAKTSWLSSLAPWSPSVETPKDVNAAFVRGKMLSRAEWKNDADVEQCCDPDCSQRFDLLNRRHHCRTCGDIFCATHSSRSTLLWPSADESVPAFTPRGTPRGTPRSSSLDLTALAAASSSTNGYSVSPTSSYISTVTISSSSSSTHSNSTSTPTSSPPNPSLMPVSARVCDRCFFSAPPTANTSAAPLLTPPVLPSHVPWAFGAATSSRPLTLRHPRGTSTSRSRSRASSPSHLSNSPPGNILPSRSRQGSAASALSASSSSASAYSTPSTSIEVLPYSTATSKQRGVSPATSLRAHSSGGSLLPAGIPPASVQEETEPVEEDELPTPLGAPSKVQEYEDGSASESDSDDEERHEQTVRERRRLQQEFGSVTWSTF